MNINGFHLPLIEKFFIYSGPESMPSCSVVCKKWNEIIKNDQYFLKHLNHEYINFFNSNKAILSYELHPEIFSDFKEKKRQEGAILDVNNIEARSEHLKEFITLKSNKEFFLNSLGSKNLRKACLNSFNFSKNKITYIINRLFKNLCLKNISKETTANLFFLLNENTLAFTSIRKEKDKEFIFILKVIEGGIEQSAPWDFYTDSTPRTKYSMVTSDLHKITLQIQTYYLNYVPFEREIKKGIDIIKSKYLPLLNTIFINHIAAIESKWLDVDSKKIAVYKITVHQKTEMGEGVYIAGEGGRVFDIDDRSFNELNWNTSRDLKWHEGHNWTCNVQRYSEEPIKFKIIFLRNFRFGEYRDEWEIIDNDPLKNRTINVGDSREIYLDNLIFQG